LDIWELEGAKDLWGSAHKSFGQFCNFTEFRSPSVGLWLLWNWETFSQISTTKSIIVFQLFHVHFEIKVDNSLLKCLSLEFAHKEHFS
jgi:hypothetical protein